MLNKLLKHDLKRNFSWLWILSVVTIGAAGISRLFMELGSGSHFVAILGGMFMGITTGLIVNVIIQPFLRYFITFQKDFYGDESYLTHTLPVTKNELIYSRYISSTIQTVFAVLVSILSLFVLYWSPSGWNTALALINYAISINCPGLGISTGWLITLLLIILVIWVFAVTSTGYMCVIISNKFGNRRTLYAVLLSIGLIYVENLIMGLLMLLGFAIAGLDLNAELMPPSAVTIMIVVAVIMQVAYWILTFLISRHLLNKGVNVD